MSPIFSREERFLEPETPPLVQPLRPRTMSYAETTIRHCNGPPRNQHTNKQNQQQLAITYTPWSDQTNRPRLCWKDLVLRETASVAVITVVLAMCRFVVVQLERMASQQPYGETAGPDKNICWVGYGWPDKNICWVGDGYTAPLARDAGRILVFIPQTLLGPNILHHPGLIFLLQTGLLLPLGRRTGCIPNLACRVCEYRMRRLNLVHFVIVLCIHVSVGCSLLWMLQHLILVVTPGTSSSDVMADASPEFLLVNLPSVFEFARGAIALACHVVGILVLPVVLALNRVSEWWTLVLLYLLHKSISLPWIVRNTNGHDNNDNNMNTNGSNVWNPVDLIGQALLAQQGTVIAVSLAYILLQQILAGWLAGRVMLRYFPDDTAEPTRQ